MKNGNWKLGVVVGLALGSLSAQENYVQWSGSRDYSLNTAASGANVSGIVTGFPVLVRLGAADSVVFTAAKAGGADLRFTKANGMRLPHQIESWNAAGRSAAIWVRADTVKGNTAMQVMRMLWGKADAADSSKGSAVFDTSNGYVAVWHMDGSGNAADATANALVAAGAGDSLPAAATGAIGPGRSFNGTSQHFTVANAAPLNFTEGFTLSVWVNAANWNGSTRLLQKSLPEENNAGQYGLRDDSNNMLSLNINGIHTNTGSLAAVPATGEWHLIHGTYDLGSAIQYQDGASVALGSFSEVINTGTGTLSIGMRPDATNYFTGTMDEVRIQKVARSAAWVKLEHENQKTSQTLVQLASQVSIRGEAARQGFTGFLAKGVPGGFVFSLPEGATEGTHVILADLSGRVAWRGEFAAGTRDLAWDGRDARGARVSTGMYVARLTVLDPQGRATTAERRLTLAR